MKYTDSKQAQVSDTIKISEESFYKTNGTSIYWLGGAGEFINSRGTTIMLDPVLRDFDMPLLYEMPILTEEVPVLDAILITHDDNDHYSVPTCLDLKDKCKAYHAPNYVADLMKQHGLDSIKHTINDVFKVNDISIKLTTADHAWKNDYPKYGRQYAFEDYCGYWIDTPDGSIWAIGDSRLLEEQLHMPEPDVIFFDFSDSSWHIGFDNAIKLANTYSNSALLLCHWGCVDAPTMTPFNADPQDLLDKVVNPNRIHILAPGEEFILKK